MARRGRGPSQTWKTFLRNHTAGIAAADFLIVPTIGFRLLFVLVILRHQRRRLISLSVTANPTAEWIARQITDAFPWNEAPDYLIRDRDASYGRAVTRRLAAMGIRDHPTAPRSPWQNGHAERLIGSIRRECLDHIVVFGDAHLRRILADYAGYYNELRTHLSLDKDSPTDRPIQRFGQLATRPNSRPTPSSLRADIIFSRHRGLGQTLSRNGCPYRKLHPRWREGRDQVA
jgi:transposase InsO family protein